MTEDDLSVLLWRHCPVAMTFTEAETMAGVLAERYMLDEFVEAGHYFLSIPRLRAALMSYLDLSDKDIDAFLVSLRDGVRHGFPKTSFG